MIKVKSENKQMKPEIILTSIEFHTRVFINCTMVLNLLLKRSSNSKIRQEMQ